MDRMATIGRVGLLFVGIALGRIGRVRRDRANASSGRCVGPRGNLFPLSWGGAYQRGPAASIRATPCSRGEKPGPRLSPASLKKACSSRRSALGDAPKMPPQKPLPPDAVERRPLGHEGHRPGGTGGKRHLDLPSPVVAVNHVLPGPHLREPGDRPAQRQIDAQPEPAVVEPAHLFRGGLPMWARFAAAAVPTATSSTAVGASH